MPHTDSATPSRHLLPVVEAPWWEGTPPWPWPIANLAPFTYAHVHAGMGHARVGSAMARIVSENVEFAPGAGVHAVLDALLVGEPCISGGLRVRGPGHPGVEPSCCSDLSDWREWERLLSTGESPWLGHDPAPWAEVAGDTVYVWPDGCFNTPRSRPGPPVRLLASDIRSELEVVESELRGFVQAVSQWAEQQSYRRVAELAQLLAHRLTLE